MRSEDGHRRDCKPLAQAQVMTLARYTAQYTKRPTTETKGGGPIVLQLHAQPSQKLLKQHTGTTETADSRSSIHVYTDELFTYFCAATAGRERVV